jgi:hypothetical protein
MPRRGIYFFVLIQKSKQKKSRQNDASARMATSPPPFCRAYAQVDIIENFLLFLCLLVSMGMKLVALFFRKMWLFTLNYIQYNELKATTVA